MIKIKTQDGFTIECDTGFDLELALVCLRKLSTYLTQASTVTTPSSLPLSQPIEEGVGSLSSISLHSAGVTHEPTEYYSVRELAMMYEEEELEAGRRFLSKQGRRMVECSLQGLGKCLRANYPEGLSVVKHGASAFPWDEKTKAIIHHWQTFARTTPLKRDSYVSKKSQITRVTNTTVNNKAESSKSIDGTQSTVKDGNKIKEPLTSV